MKKIKRPISVRHFDIRNALLAPPRPTPATLMGLREDRILNRIVIENFEHV